MAATLARRHHQSTDTAPCYPTHPPSIPGGRVDRSAEVEFLREALRRRVEQTSIRQAASEVKMSHGGIYNLVQGGVVPYGKTLAKLRTWYLAHWAAGGESLSTEAAHYLLSEMLGSVPREQRSLATLELLNRIEGVYHSFSVPPPAWLHELRRELNGDTP